MTPDRADAPVCYATCKKLDDGTLRYYDITHMIDPSYRKKGVARVIGAAGYLSVG